MITRKSLDRDEEGFNIGEQNNSNIHYADDIALLTPSENEMLKPIKIIERVNNKFGLQINKAKTKLIARLENMN